MNHIWHSLPPPQTPTVLKQSTLCQVPLVIDPNPAQRKQYIVSDPLALGSPNLELYTVILGDPCDCTVHYSAFTDIHKPQCEHVGP